MDTTLLRWASILMLAGGIAFWIGAFIPPYKQWMTSDTREYLTIIHTHKINWYFIASFMMVGVVATFLAIQLMSQAAQFSSLGKLYSILSASAYSFGAIFVIINFAFRLTVTVWAGDRLIANGELEPSFQTWMDWSNLLFAAYMILAYLSIGFFGLALQDLDIVPYWVIWFCILFGFGGILGFIVQLPLFAPPLMIHLPFIITGVVLLLKMKT
jgi:hypothetical protein